VRIMEEKFQLVAIPEKGQDKLPVHIEGKAKKNSEKGCCHLRDPASETNPRSLNPPSRAAKKKGRGPGNLKKAGNGRKKSNINAFE